MRKVLFVISLLFILAGPLAVKESYCETKNEITLSGEEYTYEVVYICGERWIIVYDKDQKMIDMFPDLCGGG